MQALTAFHFGPTNSGLLAHSESVCPERSRRWFDHLHQSTMDTAEQRRRPTTLARLWTWSLSIRILPFASFSASSDHGVFHIGVTCQRASAALFRSYLQQPPNDGNPWLPSRPPSGHVSAGRWPHFVYERGIIVRSFYTTSFATAGPPVVHRRSTATSRLTVPPARSGRPRCWRPRAAAQTPGSPPSAASCRSSLCLPSSDCATARAAPPAR